jgi:mannose/fructose/N-acetylgalactosamine-specific phosphotransferase system component IID
VLAAMLGRLFLLQAVWNYERMQGIGFAHALAPAAKKLAGDDASAARALVPQVGYFNTHPVMAAVAVGVVADQMERRARGVEALDDAGILRVKQALGSSLAAMGDPLFWNAVRPLVALAAVYGWREERSWLGAFTILLGYNTFAIGYRVRGLFEGYKRGLPYVAQLPKKLGRLADSLRLLCVVLCALVCATILVPSDGSAPGQVLAGGVGLLLGGLLFGIGRLGPGEWGLVLVLSVLAWVTIGPGF